MPTIPDQCLFQAAAPIDHINQIINNTVLQSHDNIQISESDIGIYNCNLFSHGSQSGPDICHGGGFSNTAFSRCNDNDFTHVF